ncbi:DUF6624 domain-containing protein [Flavobacterium sp. '19STA2R22 D10 B1']|uniref:DUF6624 domain-containing protein n=1 Tax=Flavobacterium aerium TaxID=3037261 RepID=UPI00278BBD91|nr:DUF6624 domain-containing protein [Flavobacterium sp. '19STA2R22 D10 B1']
MNNEIAKELIALAQYDLAVRERLYQEGKLMDGYNPEMEAVHIENATKLKNIIALIGWPTIDKVGVEASDSAWLIAQHSIGDPQFMKQCLSLMEANIEQINPQNIAYMHDRICCYQGRLQRYGTQYNKDGSFCPVEDKDQVNANRARVQLKPISIERINEKDTLGDDPQYNEWRKKVGWIL